MVENQQQQEKNFQVEYAVHKSKEISKKVFSYWDIFLFCFIFVCAMLFFCGLVLFLFGGIGFDKPDFDPSIFSKGTFKDITFNGWNGYWTVSSCLNGKMDWETFTSNINSTGGGAGGPSVDHLKLAANLMKKMYDAGLSLLVISSILLLIFTVFSVIGYYLWKKGYFNAIGSRIFNKFEQFKNKIDNYESPSDLAKKGNQTNSNSVPPQINPVNNTQSQPINSVPPPIHQNNSAPAPTIENDNPNVFSKQNSTFALSNLGIETSTLEKEAIQKAPTIQTPPIVNNSNTQKREDNQSNWHSFNTHSLSNDPYHRNNASIVQEDDNNSDFGSDRDAKIRLR